MTPLSIVALCAADCILPSCGWVRLHPTQQQARPPSRVAAASTLPGGADSQPVAHRSNCSAAQAGSTCPAAAPHQGAQINDAMLLHTLLFTNAS